MGKVNVSNLFKNIDSQDGQTDKIATVENCMEGFKKQEAYNCITSRQWAYVENKLKEADTPTSKGINLKEFKDAFELVERRRESIQAFYAADSHVDDGGANARINNPQVCYEVLINSPMLKGKLTEEQKEEIFDLLFVIHLNPNGIDPTEFDALFDIAKDAVDGIDISSNELYLKTFFDALDETEHHDGKKDGKFDNGNTLWGKLRAYSSLKSDLTMDEWNKLYNEDIKTKASDGIDFKEFKDIFKKGVTYAQN